MFQGLEFAMGEGFRAWNFSGVKGFERGILQGYNYEKTCILDRGGYGY
jgi:hypothetical protein